MAYRSNGLQGALNITKNRRAGNVNMSAAFASNGAPLGRRPNMKNNNDGSDEFTITHHEDKVEKPWGFPRQTKIMMAEAALDAEDFVPDMQRRSIMNLVLLGGAAVPVGWLGGGFVYFFVPATGGGGEGALKALDANGDVVK